MPGGILPGMKTALGALLLAASLGLGACKSSAPDGPCEYGIVTTLHLGRSTPDGGTVDDAALTQFLDEVVAPRFPAGFTVLRGEDWRHGAGDAPAVHADAVLLQIAHCETKDAEQALKEVAAAYAERFAQDDVPRTDSRAKLYW